VHQAHFPSLSLLSALFPLQLFPSAPLSLSLTQLGVEGVDLSPTGTTAHGSHAFNHFPHLQDLCQSAELAALEFCAPSHQASITGWQIQIFEHSLQ
jgi:hypothetical protein